MSGTRGPTGLERLLDVDPRDAGCDHARHVLHVYAELVQQDDGIAAARYPEVAAHLAACGPCEQDLEGLLHLITDQE
jgi:hypothetical protein